MMKGKTAMTGAERAAKLRDKGRSVAVVMTDAAAIASLDRLTRGKLGLTQREALERGLVLLDKLTGASSRKAT